VTKILPRYRQSGRFCLDAHSAIEHFPSIGRYVVNLTQAMFLNRDERLILLGDPLNPLIGLTTLARMGGR